MHLRELIVIAAVVGGGMCVGTAFTAGAGTTGQGSGAVSGVTAERIVYDTNDASDTIETVTLVLRGDTTGSTIRIAFNGDDPAACSDAGGYDGTSSTTYRCTVHQSVAAAEQFRLVAL